MKKFKYFLLSLSMAAGLFFAALATPAAAEENWPTAPEVSAESAIIMEADSGAILYEKNIHEQRYPASITKIMTTLLALEKCPLSDNVHFSKDAVYNVEGTQVGITPDEEVPLDECLYGVMLASGNEIAYAVAEHVGGTYDNFVAMMNKRASSLGCLNTHFNNPHGLPDENHYTSAYDMALIAKAAYAIDSFKTISGTRYHIIPPTNLYGEERAMANHHKMITNSIYHYDYCTGGKTGYTNAARYNLVTFAEKDGMKLICVIMKDQELAAQYNDSAALLDYAFQNFKKIQLTTNDLGVNLKGSGLFPIENSAFTENSADISISNNAYVVLPNNLELANLSRTINYSGSQQGKLGSINYLYGQHFLGDIPITYTNNTKATSKKTAVPADNSNKFFKINLRTILFVIIGICAAILIVALAAKFIYNHHFVKPLTFEQRKRRAWRKKHRSSFKIKLPKRRK